MRRQMKCYICQKEARKRQILMLPDKPAWKAVYLSVVYLSERSKKIFAKVLIPFDQSEVTEPTPDILQH